ncbi:hypothetical protein GCM10010313_28790 [Streptomyces violarus]|nr:hypothetical protein GCM10010313_28790 [Streptomyces violarus]
MARGDGADAEAARLATVLGKPLEEVEKRKQTPLLALDFVFRPQASLTALWAVARFRHFDNRNGFPLLHDHYLILNRVRRHARFSSCSYVARVRDPALRHADGRQRTPAPTSTHELGTYQRCLNRSSGAACSCARGLRVFPGVQCPCGLAPSPRTVPLRPRTRRCRLAVEL